MKEDFRILCSTKIIAQKTMVELRKYVENDVVVDIEEFEVSSMSGHTHKEFYVVLRR